MRVRITDAARDDLISIWNFLADISQRTADSCIDRIVARCDQLIDFPLQGVDRSDIGSGTRMLVIERWLILYHVTSDEVRIGRIVDGARDLSNIVLPNDQI